MLKSKSAKLCIQDILDPAYIILNDIYDPEPSDGKIVKDYVLMLHQSFNTLYSKFQSLLGTIRVGGGNNEDAIIKAISDVIADATKLAVICEQNRQIK